MNTVEIRVGEPVNIYEDTMDGLFPDVKIVVEFVITNERGGIIAMPQTEYTFPSRESVESHETIIKWAEWYINHMADIYKQFPKYEDYKKYLDDPEISMGARWYNLDLYREYTKLREPFMVA